MTKEKAPENGRILWTDLTVSNADEIRDFYSAVTGWRHAPVEMGDYSDYNMIPAEGGEPAAGICFARGANRNLPAQWLIHRARRKGRRRTARDGKEKILRDPGSGRRLYRARR